MRCSISFLMSQHGDYAAALKELRPAAEQGHADAQYSLGLMYAEGQGVPTDDTEVAKWFRKAAEQGMALAQGYWTTSPCPPQVLVLPDVSR